jgi:hypothetical protein
LTESFGVLSYEGEKNKGFFEGYGKAVFKGGHRYEVTVLIFLSLFK